MHATPKAIPIERIESESLADKTIESVKRAMDTIDWKTFYYAARESLCMPECLRNQTLELAHEGHPGMSVMKRRIRAKVWWPRIDPHVEDFVKKCKDCSLVGAPSPPEPLSRRSLPSAAWEHLAIDHIGPLPSKHYLLVSIGKRNWQDDLQDYLLMYQSTQHSTTMMTPAEMMFSRNIRDKLPSIRAPRSDNDEEVRDRDTEMKHKGKQYADMKRHAEPNEIREAL
ncbi:hypothetical protein HA402_013129 [Bradysia odoriphaga]|nr:hypothetical protein HA402_013129 [Bradysia odoriphaga]